MSHHVLANTTKDENVVLASLPASFGGKMPPLPSIFKGGGAGFLSGNISKYISELIQVGGLAYVAVKTSFQICFLAFCHH